MAPDPGNVLTVLLVEGPTEEIFYGRVKAEHLDHACSVKIECIEGLYNVNTKILQALTTKHKDQRVRAYCCLDRESRYASVPVFDLGFIRRDLRQKGASNVLSVDAIIATRMIESCFFYDVAGIYAHLRVPRAQRQPKKYRPPEKFCVEDLKDLFRRYGKNYIEGDRAENFINKLDLKKIVRECASLRDGINLILRRGRS
jgi:hypothetical protein